MGLETFSIELEAELQKFLKNLQQAQTNLLKIQTIADKVASGVDASFANVKIDLDAKSLEQTAQGLDAVKEKGSGVGDLFVKIKDNFAAVRSTVVVLGKTLEILGERLNIPALQTFGKVFFEIGLNVDTTSDAFERLVRAFKSGDIEGISDTFGVFAGTLRNLGQLLSNFGKSLKRIALLGKLAGGALGIFSTKFKIIKTLAPILSRVGEALDTVGQKARKAAGFLGEVGEQLPESEAARATTILGSLKKLLFSFLKLAAVVAIFKGLKFVLTDIGRGSLKLTKGLIRMAAALGLGVRGAAGLLANIVGLNTPLGQLLTRTGAVAAGFNRMAVAASTFAKRKDVRTKARVASIALNKFEGSIGRVAKRLPGVGLATRAAGKAMGFFKNTVAPAGRAVNNLFNKVLGLTGGLVGMTPKLGKTVKNVKKLTIAAGVAAGATGNLGAAATLAGGALTTVTGAVLGLNALLVVLGVTLDAIGTKIINTFISMAKSADITNLAFIRLNNTLKAQEAATGIALGGAEDFRKLTQSLSAATGQSVVKIAKLLTVFVGLNQTIKLPQEKLIKLAESTVLAGTAIGDLGGSLVAVKDIFLNTLRPFTLRFGATIKQADADKLAAEKADNHAAAQAGLSDAARVAATNIALAELAIKALAPSADVATKTANSLRIETGKLTAAQANIGRILGDEAVPSLAAFTAVVRKTVEALTPLIKATAFITVPLITTAATVLQLVGTFLKWGVVIALVSNALGIMNFALTTSIGKFGTIGAKIGNFVSTIVGRTVEIKGAGSLFTAFGALIQKGAATAGTAFAKLGGQISAGAKKAALAKVSFAPLTGIFSNLFGVLRKGIPFIFGLIKAQGLLFLKFTIIATVIAVIISAAVRLFKKYDILNRIVKKVTKIFAAFGKEGSALSKVLEKIGIIIELVVLGTLKTLEGILLAVAIAVQGLAKVFRFLSSIVRVLGFGFGELGKKGEEAADAVDDMAARLRDELIEGLNETDKAIVESGKALAGIGDKADDAGKKLGGVGKKSKEVALTLAQLKPFAELGVAGLTRAIENSANRLDRKLDQLNNVFVNQSARLAGTVGKSTGAALIALEAQLTKDVIKVQQEEIARTKAFIEQRRTLEINALKTLRDDKNVKNAEILADIQKVNEAALKEEVAFLDAQKKEVDKRINVIKAAQASRVQTNKAADLSILDSGKSLTDQILANQLKVTTGAEREAFVRQQVALQTAVFRRQLEDGQLDLAKTTRDEITSIQRQGLEVSKKTANLQRALSKIGIEGTEEDNRKAAQEITKVHGKIPKDVAKAFTTLQQRLRRIDLGPIARQQAEDAKREFDRVVANISTKENTAQLEKIREAERRLTSELTDATESLRKKRKAAEDERIKDLQTFSDAVNTSIVKAKASLKDPASLFIDADLSLFNKAIQALRTKLAATPFRAKLILDKVETGSPTVPLHDAADKIRELLDPGDLGIQAGFTESLSRAVKRFQDMVSRVDPVPSVVTNPPDTSGGQEPQGSSKTIRVDLNLGGQNFPVDVADNESADSLTRFSRELTNIGRTRGNFKSPLS